MSARQKLIEEVSRQPESVAGQLLVYLHSLPGYPAADAARDGNTDYFAAYWSKLYGSCEGEDWEEPAGQAFEKREEW